MIFAYNYAGDTATNPGNCRHTYGSGNIGSWQPVRLLSSTVPPAVGAATFGVVQDGAGDPYLCINNPTPAIGFTTGKCCVAYYETASSSTFANAYAEADAYWPIFSATGEPAVPSCTYAPPPSPPPPSPSPPMVATEVSLQPGPNNQHAGLVCKPYDTALLFEWGVNAPAYPLLYAYSFFPSMNGNYFMCESSNTASVGNFQPVQLPSQFPPNNGVSATFGVVGTGPYYLCVDHGEAAANTCCLAYYNTGASDFNTAFGLMVTGTHPIIATDGRPMHPVCAPPSPPPSPPPPSPPPPSPPPHLLPQASSSI